MLASVDGDSDSKEQTAEDSKLGKNLGDGGENTGRLTHQTYQSQAPHSWSPKLS